MKTGLCSVLGLVAVLAFTLNTFAQDAPQWLPEGAKVRLVDKTDIQEIAYSPDGTRLAVASSIGLWIYDVETGEELNTLTGHTDVVWSVSFSPDGSTLASGSADRTIRLWDANTGEHLHTLTRHTGFVRNVSFSPDGSKLASASEDRTVGLWDANTGEHLHTLTGHTEYVFSVSFSPDSSTLASGSRDHTVRLWDVATGEHLRTFWGHTDQVFSVSFSPDGSTLASGSRDHSAWLWNTTTGEYIHALTGHTSWVYGVSFSPDGSTLASGSADHTVRLWDVATGKYIRMLTGHKAWVRSVSFSPDGSTLASGSADGSVLLWELNPTGPFNTIVRMSATPVQSPTIGELLTFPLNITAGENVAGYQATISYDTTALRYVSSTNGDYLPSGALFVPPVIKENKVTLAVATLAGKSNGDGTLARLTFELIALKSSTLTLSGVSLVDPDGTRSSPRIENTEVEIIEALPLVEDVNADGVVNIQDLVLVASKFGQTGATDADVNEDNVVDIVDLVLVARALGNAAAAPSALQREKC